LQANIRRSPANLAPTPSLWGSFLADPEVGFSSGFSISFNTDFPCCGGGSLLSFGNSSDGQNTWIVGNGGSVPFNTGNSYTDGVEVVVFQLEFNVSGTTDRLRVWFDANPNTEPPSFTVDAEFGQFAPRLIVAFNSSNNFGGSTLAIDEIRVGAFEDVVIPATPALVLTSAASRKTHGMAGTFDIDLPLTGTPGIECRSTGGNHTLVFTFPNNIVSGAAQFTAGAGSIAGTPAISGNTMTVNLSGVADVQQIAVTLSEVTDSFGQVLPDTDVNVGLLGGDTTGNRAVNSSDIAQTRSQSGAPLTNANFRSDVTADGAINASDLGLVKSRSGVNLP
jgi:hypothetical protein